ncbi:MAG: PAS domain-containing protein [Alphaproteobacteria bacterium]|nr:PAS domain-containing protein [Alphaproteobacteria bacterium]
MLPATLVGASSEVTDARLRRLHEYWNAKRGARPAPTRREIDPVEIPDLLGFVNIFEVQNDPRDYKVRLNGTEVAEMLGQEITGRFCSTVLSGPDATNCKTAFDLCVDRRQPMIVETSLAFCGKPYMAQTVIVLPLSSDGEQIDMIITAHSYYALASAEEPTDLDTPRRAVEN